MKNPFKRKSLKEQEIPYVPIDNDIHAQVINLSAENGFHAVVLAIDEEESEHFTIGKKVKILKSMPAPIQQNVQMTPAGYVMQPQNPTQPQPQQPVQPMQPVAMPQVQPPQQSQEIINEPMKVLMDEFGVKFPKKEAEKPWIPSDLKQRVQNLLDLGVNDAVEMSKAIFGMDHHEIQFNELMKHVSEIVNKKEPEKPSSKKPADEENDADDEKESVTPTLTAEDTPSTPKATKKFNKYAQRMLEKGKVRKICTVCGKRKFGDANQIKFMCDECKENKDEQQ
jgi:hypothetical protein